MGIPWRKIGGALKGLMPFIPFVGGPAGAILNKKIVFRGVPHEGH